MLLQLILNIYITMPCRLLLWTPASEEVFPLLLSRSNCTTLRRMDIDCGFAGVQESRVCMSKIQNIKNTALCVWLCGAAAAPSTIDRYSYELYRCVATHLWEDCILIQDGIR